MVIFHSYVSLPEGNPQFCREIHDEGEFLQTNRQVQRRSFARSVARGLRGLSKHVVKQVLLERVG